MEKGVFSLPIIVAFIPDGVEAKGTMNVLEYAKKMDKKRIIIS